MKRVLVTGAASELGRALVRHLADDPRVEHVLAVDAGPCEPPPGAEARVHCLRAALDRSRGLRTVLFGAARPLAIDAIVHLAASPGPGTAGCLSRADATRELLRLAEEVDSVQTFLLRSHARVYQLRPSAPTLIGEDHPIALDAGSAVRELVDTDLTVCAAVGVSRLRVLVLRAAECLADPESPLHAYLSGGTCLRALGYNPMVHVISIADLVRAIHLALGSRAQGVFNVAGHDVLPLSELVARAGRRELPLPGPVLEPLYRLRSILTRQPTFHYAENRRAFHHSAVLDGRRAQAELGYEPHTGMDWRSPETALEVTPSAG